MLRTIIWGIPVVLFVMGLASGLRQADESPPRSIAPQADVVSPSAHRDA
jgi:hypothetical protein